MNNIGYKLDHEINVQVEQELASMKGQLQEKRDGIEQESKAHQTRVAQLSANYEEEREKTLQRYRQV